MERATSLRVTHDQLECGVCARTLLTGERAQQLVNPSGDGVIVCELCVAGARAAGWERGEIERPLARRPRAPVVVRGMPSTRSTRRGRAAGLAATRRGAWP